MAVLSAAYTSARDEKEVQIDERLAAYSDVSDNGGYLHVRGSHGKVR
jgi:hypothetical protein